MTALSLFTNNTATSTLSTAKSLISSGTSTTSASNATKVGTATGYGEIYSGGIGNNWPALGSIGSPSGNGCLYDTTALEGLTFVSGNWTGQLRLHISLAGIIADIYLRFYRYNAGTYTAIGQVTALGTTLTTSNTNYTFSTASYGAVTFGTGDKLYVDQWANITSNTSGNSGTQYSWDAFCTVSNTGDSRSFLTSPGVVVAGSAAIAANAALTESAQILANSQLVQANAALVEANALILSAATAQSNALINQQGALLSAQAAIQGNSALVEAAQILAMAQLQANSAGAESALIIASAIEQANSLLAVTGGLRPQFGTVTLGDQALNTLIISDKAG